MRFDISDYQYESEANPFLRNTSLMSARIGGPFPLRLQLPASLP
jgi:hypothetical protein